MTQDDPYVPVDAGTPRCPECRKVLLFEVYPGYEHNEWVAYCPEHGLISPDEGDPATTTGRAEVGAIFTEGKHLWEIVRVSELGVDMRGDMGRKRLMDWPAFKQRMWRVR